MIEKGKSFGDCMFVILMEPQLKYLFLYIDTVEGWAFLKLFYKQHWYNDNKNKSSFIFYRQNKSYILGTK